MVRCVIQGQGKAWFDSLKLTVVEPDALEAPIEDITAAPLDTPDPAADEFIAASKVMQETIAGLEMTNKALLKQLAAIQQDLDMYRHEVNKNNTAQKRTRGLHPIIPVDYEPLEELVNE